MGRVAEAMTKVGLVNHDPSGIAYYSADRFFTGPGYAKSISYYNGWQARHTCFDSLGQAKRHWHGGRFDDPLACLADAQVQNWGDLVPQERVTMSHRGGGNSVLAKLVAMNLKGNGFTFK